MDIKEVLSSELRFKGDETKKNFWKNRFFVGVDKNEERILVTEKGKEWKKEGKVSVIYKGEIPETREDFMKLLGWLKIIPKENEG